MRDAATPQTSAVRDRSLRLRLFGVLAVLAGCGSILLGALHLLLLAVSGREGFEALPIDPRAGLMGALMYGGLGAAFVWVGFGSIQRKRWARSMMLTLAWCWLLAGVGVVLLLPSLLEVALISSPASAAMEPSVRATFRWTMLGLGAVGGVLLPAIFIWIYNDRHLRQTCERHDPVESWTERCPQSVVGISAALGAGGLLLAVMALRPAFPLFGRLIVGWPGAVAMLAGAVFCLWLAKEIYLRTARGWWATAIAFLLAGVSTWITLERIDPVEMFQALGYPPEVLPDERFLSLSGWLTLAMTLLTLVYLGYIRRHFLPPADGSAG